MKLRITLMGCLLALVLAAPAFAYDLQTSGMFDTRMIMANLTKDKGKAADTLTDSRLRFLAKLKIDEYIQVAYWGELDFQYGDASYTTARNQGGAIGGDSVNLETKNLYGTLTLPGTPYSATLGLQGFRDNFSFALALDDVAGLTVVADTKPVKFKAGWFKLLEGDDGKSDSPGHANINDDATLWSLQTCFAPSKQMNLNLDGYFYQNMGSSQMPNMTLLGTSEKLYYLGADVKYALPAADVDAWLFYNFGTSKEAAANGGDLKTSALAASAKVKFNVGPVKAGVRGIYFSGDDDATDNDRTAVRIPWASTNPVHEAVPFLDSNLMIMLPDKFGTTYHNGSGFGMTPAYQEHGLLAATADASYVPSSLPKFYVNGAVGYFKALEDSRKGDTPHKGTYLGSEVCVRMGYLLGEHTDLSLNGAYAVLGDFYDGTASNGQNPDNPYETYVRINVKF